MSKASWQTNLKQTLKELQQHKQFPRLAVVGIGNELNGDDAAGVEIIRRLKAHVSQSPNILFVVGGSAPENQTATLRRFHPDLVLFIDAAEMQAAPGSIAWVAWQETDGLSASTHSLPPSVLAKFLISELNCSISLLAIQAQQLEIGREISDPVSRAIREIVRGLKKTFTLIQIANSD